MLAVEVAARAAQLAHLRRATGMALARGVYFNIKEAGPYAAYPRLVQLLSLAGVDVGTLNHSKDFAVNVMGCIHEEISAKIAKHLATPDPVLNGKKPPFAACADKMTALHQTTQVVACIFMCEGVLIAMLLSNLVAYTGGDSGNAAGIAARLVEGLSAYFSLEDIAERCTSLAVDGAYIHSGVPRALRETLKLDDDSAHWLYGRWDVAHKLELAIGDVRRCAPSNGTRPSRRTSLKSWVV